MIAPLLLPALVVVAACGGSSESEELSLATLPASVAARYRFVEAHPELVEQLPCYCGCGESQGHRSLRDCFVRDTGGYDSHAAGCGICLLEADDAERLYAEGETVAAIRTFIDARYGAVGRSTDTPPVGRY